MDIHCGFDSPVAGSEKSRGTCVAPKNRLIDLLNEVDKHVEMLRRDLLLLDEKKDALLTTLDTIRHSDMMSQLSSEENAEVEEYADNLVKTCSAIDIKVTTYRDQRQEEALYQVNKLIDSLVVVFRSDPRSARARCISYVSACASQVACKAVEVGVEEAEDVEEEIPSQGFLPDALFEEVMFLCAPDDRKRVERRLQGLLAYIERERDFPPNL